MYTAILVASICFLALAWLFWMDDENFLRIIWAGIVGGFIGFLVGGFIAVIIGINCDYTYRVLETQPILSLTGDIALEGDFVLGCGSVGEERCYYYYVYDSQIDGVKLEKQDVEDCYLREVPLYPQFGEKPHVEKLTEEISSPKLKKWAFAPGTITYKFVIPQNTIKYDFKVDF